MLQFKESVEKIYKISELQEYTSDISSLKIVLREYHFGFKGSNSIINTRLAALNTLTSTDPHSSNCLTHTWALSPTDCPSNS